MIRFMLQWTAAAALLAAGCAGTQTREGAVERDARGAAASPLLRHVVLFKFKDGTSPENVRKIEDAFRALPGRIDAIHDFEWGTDVSTEGRAQGFTHCFVVTFKTQADLATYLPHPAHDEFRSILGPHLDKVLVVDYWAKE